MKSLLKSEIYQLDKDIIALKGVTPIKALPGYVNEGDSIIYDKNGQLGMRFEVQLKSRIKDGDISVSNGILNIENATDVTLIIVANTSFNGFNKEPGTEGKDEKLLCRTQLEKLKDKSYEEILMIYQQMKD